MNVIYHVDEMAKWTLSLTNVQNMIQYYGEHGEAYEIEIVANSEAVAALTKDRAAELGLLPALESFQGLPVQVAACANALRAQKIPAEALVEGVQVVPAGVVEIAQREAEGYRYLKP